MSEQLNEEFDDDLSPEELFEQAIKTSDTIAESDEPEETIDEINYDHEPSDEDPEEYWKGFAESKGWKDDPSTVKPGYWTDYRAFVNKYGTIQESKSAKAASADLERKLDKLTKTTMEVAQRVTAQHQREVSSLKTQLEAKQQEAKDMGDFDEYEKAGEQLKQLDEANQEAKQEEAAGEHETVRGFRETHPEIMEGSESYDPEINELLQLKLNNAISTGKVTTEDQWLAMAEKELDHLKSINVKYQAKPVPRPPDTANMNGARKPVKMDVGSLDAGERAYYQHFIENGMKDAAKEFLENAIKGRS